MRRMWAAGAAMLLSLALGGAPVVAQSPSPAATSQPTWAAVTGTEQCAPPSGGTVQLKAAPYTVSGAVFACADTASDARVTGPSTMTFNMLTSDPRVVQTGWSVTYNGTAGMDYVINGPDGNWTGHGYGIYDSDGALYLMTMLAGDGAYDGLTYSLLATIPPNTLTAVTVGVIQPGTLPTSGSSK